MAMIAGLAPAGEIFAVEFVKVIEYPLSLFWEIIVPFEISIHPILEIALGKRLSSFCLVNFIIRFPVIRVAPARSRLSVLPGHDEGVTRHLPAFGSLELDALRFVSHQPTSGGNTRPN